MNGTDKSVSYGVRALLIIGLYTVFLTGFLYFSYLVKFDFSLPNQFWASLALIVVWTVPLKLLFLLGFHQFAGGLSFFSTPDLGRLTSALALGSLSITVVSAMAPIAWKIPSGVIVFDFAFTLLGLSAMRLSFRLIRERFFSTSCHSKHGMRKVGIIGAGYVGASLARELTIKRGLGLQPMVFFDDDPHKWRSRVHGVPVVGPPELLLNPKADLELEKVIIAMPSAPPKRIKEIVQTLQSIGIRFETVPSMDQLATGQVKVSQLRSVEIQDLLGRDPVKLEMENIQAILKGRTVMVTGAGGSIGSELCRQIISYSPKNLLLVEQSEVQIFQIEQELVGLDQSERIVPLVGDILDVPRMRNIFERFQPDVVFHAAAHKHVPMMERQPGEAIKNNIFGTVQVASLALEYGVDRFVHISTDKAINPTNVMGASKRFAEIFLQSLFSHHKDKTKYMAVRFGNVLGSSGSVIPIFNKQIAAGGPVTVTHPDVTRYFMTIPEAVSLVLQSGAQGRGGEIFVLDMGKPIKIVDLAKQLIELSGFKVGEDIKIEFSGLRPGEKLYEELNHEGENLTPTTHPKIMRFVSDAAAFEEVLAFLNELAPVTNDSKPKAVKRLLKKAVPEYLPYADDSLKVSDLENDQNGQVYQFKPNGVGKRQMKSTLPGLSAA